MPTRSIAQANWRRAALSVARRKRRHPRRPYQLRPQHRGAGPATLVRGFPLCLNTRHVPVTNYGTEVPRAQQLVPGGVQEFENLLEAWLTNTLAAQFGLRLSWAGKGGALRLIRSALLAFVSYGREWGMEKLIATRQVRS